MPSKAGTHLFTLTGIACCGFGLGIIKVKDVIIIEVTLENIPRKVTLSMNIQNIKTSDIPEKHKNNLTELTDPTNAIIIKGPSYL